MSSLVLLNDEGVVGRKLQLISLPDDYVVPEGMTISWRTDLHASSSNPLASLFGPTEPVEAHFYLGNACGRVERKKFKEYEQEGKFGPIRYGPRTLTIVVQGTSAKDVMGLRDHIMNLINSGAHWEVRNDLNRKPKTGLLDWLKRMVGMSK